MRYSDLKIFRREVEAAGFEYIEPRPTNHRGFVLARDYGIQARRPGEDRILFIRNRDEIARLTGGAR